MEKIIGIALVAVCFLGCKKELHDSALRQQLTKMVSSLDDRNQKAVDQANKDIDAVLSVNSAKMSEEQKKKLSSARLNLSALSGDLVIRESNEVFNKTSKGVLDNKEVGVEINELFDETKKLISEVAATF